MSRKQITENIENMGEIPADLGPALKLLGTVLTEQFQGANGTYLSKEEREKNKAPLAEIIQSDIQIRFGNRMMTLVPAKEGKPMVSIPVGQSDKKTPATIPREWLVGALIDGLLSIFDGDTQVVGVFINSRIKKAIEEAMEVNEDGKMKVVTSKLPTHDHPVEVAEFLEALKYSFVSKSAGSAKLNFGIEFTELEPIAPVEEEIVEEEEVQADWHEEAAKRLLGESPIELTEQDVIEAVDSIEDAELVAFIQEGDEMIVADPPYSEDDNANDAYWERLHAEHPERFDDNGSYHPPMDDDTDWKPQENAVETIALMNEMTENARNHLISSREELTQQMVSHAVKQAQESEDNEFKFPTLRGEKGLAMREAWIYHQVAHHDQNKTIDDSDMTVNMLAELAGVNVQTIKRVIDYIVEKEGYEEDWTDFTQAPEDFAPHTFGFECERSDTGRYVRGSEIYIHYFENEDSSLTVQSIVDYHDKEDEIEEPLTLKEVDETDPALSPCPDCGRLTLPSDAPKDAPDFVCNDCHDVRMEEDEEWAEETKQRSELNSIIDGSARTEDQYDLSKMLGWE